MMNMTFEWDEEKASENVRNRGIYFEDAELIFDDPFRIERYDTRNSAEEDRWQTVGSFDDVLFVAYTERGDNIRIISARLATPKERRIYDGDSKTYPQGWYRVKP